MAINRIKIITQVINLHPFFASIFCAGKKTQETKPLKKYLNTNKNTNKNMLFSHNVMDKPIYTQGNNQKKRKKEKERKKETATKHLLKK